VNTRREAILREMGLGPLWKLRDAPAEDLAAAEQPVQAETGAAFDEAPAAEYRAETPSPLVAPAADSAQTALVVPAAPASTVNSPAATMDWDELEATIKSCKACNLCRDRRQAVPGVGDRQADWLFVGEGPGAEEDERGEPFVGQAGKLLDAMMAAIDIKRGEDVYIANAVKCRPPGNRTPEPEETAACWPYLQRQIALIQPKLIIALGRPAAQTLLQQEVKIGAARGHLHDYQGIPVIVTYHPAYLLRNLTDKAKAWEDLVLARRTMKQRKGND